MTEELSYETHLHFYPVTIKKWGIGRYIVISSQSANWIVLDNNTELSILTALIAGKSLGQIIESIGENNEEGIDSLQRVLAKIAAREFAGVANLPTTTYVEGFKMLNIYVTNSCNLSCPHCFMNAGKALQNELSYKDICRILTEFKQNGGISVTFTGGEPMMRTDFIQILKYAHTLGLSSTVLTNGLLWTEQNIEEAAKYVNEVQVSIDGVDESTNATVRGKDKFDKAVDTVKTFTKQGIRVSVATTFSPTDLSITLLDKYIALKSDIEQSAKGTIIFKLSKKILPGRGKSHTILENQEYMDKISKLEDAVCPDAKLENFKLGHEPNEVSRNCGIGGMSIRSDGHVFFCNRVHEVDDYGHIFSRPFIEWLNIGRDINEKTSVDHVSPCKSCELKNICNGGCRIDDFAGNKGLTKTNGKDWVQTSCTEAKRQKLLEKMVEMFDYYYDFSQ